MNRYVAKLEDQARRAWTREYRLQAERDRYREALETIRDQGPTLTPGWQHWREIAREALSDATSREQS